MAQAPTSMHPGTLVAVCRPSAQRGASWCVCTGPGTSGLGLHGLHGLHGLRGLWLRGLWLHGLWLRGLGLRRLVELARPGGRAAGRIRELELMQRVRCPAAGRKPD